MVQFVFCFYLSQNYKLWYNYQYFIIAHGLNRGLRDANDFILMDLSIPLNFLSPDPYNKFKPLKRFVVCFISMPTN